MDISPSPFLFSLMRMSKLVCFLLLALIPALSCAQLLVSPRVPHEGSMERDSVISIEEIVQHRREMRSKDSLRVLDSLTAAGYVEDALILNEESDKDSVAIPVSSLIVAGEVLGQNVFVWAWDYWVLDKNYAHTGPGIWKRNFREGWKWDHNHWAINFYGHPYQGSFYYTAARGSGYGFYPSMAFATLGSFTWEMFAETEYPAPNDFIMTTVGGSMYGEVLYRLSRLVYGSDEVPWYRQAGAFMLHPGSFIQRKVFGNRDFRTGWVPVELGIALGAGSRFGSEYRIGSQGAKNLDMEWHDRHSMMALTLEYGKPYRTVREPFEYFKIDFYGEGGFEGNLLNLDVMGKLKNVNVHGRGHWLDFSIILDYENFYGDLATISNLSLGQSLDMSLWLTPRFRFRIMNHLNYILLATADMGYDDIIKEFHPEYHPDKDSYQYNLGVRYGILLEFLYKDKWRLYNKGTADALHTIPSSTPHYGADGWDFLVLNHTALEYRVNSWLDVGNRLDTYVKLAAYSSDYFEPMSRRIFTFSLYLNFHLLSDAQ